MSVQDRSSEESSVTLDGISIFSGSPVSVLVEGPTIAQVADRSAGGALPYLAPGFFDLQVNGYRGIDYTSDSLTEADIVRLIGELAASGTTTHLPTIITSPREIILRNLAILARARRRSPEVESAIPGYHMEGPFISPEEGPRGAHSSSQVRDADFEEYRAWQDAAEGLIRIVTVAPEVRGALAFIERVAQEGVVVAIGHTAASPERIREAVRAGARLSTHLGNGSHAMLPRLKNYIWEQLGADGLAASIISDGYHLPEAVVRTISRAKGLDRLVLVSDVAVNGGAEPGIYRWGDLAVEVFPDGHLGVHRTEFLAGAGHLLDHDVAQFVRFTGCAIGDAVRLCTTAPSRLLGLPSREGFCATGQPADLVLFDHDAAASRLVIRTTVQSGRVLYERPSGRG